MKIEKDVPVPPRSTGPGSNKYPFAEMEVGDSVLFDEPRLKSPPYLAAQYHARKTGKKFVGRVVEGGVRIWRVE